MVNMDYENDPVQVNTLSDDYKRILHSQVIDKVHPGTILHDFEILLSFIGTDGIEVSEKNNFFSAESLADLNSKLSHPLDIRHKRPRQRSYPNINGLFLLLRATGLAFPERRGKKLLLVLDPSMLQSWNGLNMTEQYFILFESWQMRGRPEIMGEGESYYRHNLMRWLDIFRIIPDKGLDISDYTQQTKAINYSAGLPNTALLELFGLILIDHGAAEEGKGWRIAGVRRTFFGIALLQLMMLYYRRNVSDFMSAFESKEESFGMLYPTIQPFFPQLKNNLVIAKPAFQDGTYVFKVSIGSVWRRIAIAGAENFETLSFAILDAFDFDYDHLYSFLLKDRYGSAVEINHPAMDEPLYANRERIGDISMCPGMTMVFWYDFGDDWQFKVKLERIDPLDPEIKEAKVLAKRGEAPNQYLDYSFF